MKLFDAIRNFFSNVKKKSMPEPTITSFKIESAEPNNISHATTSIRVSYETDHIIPNETILSFNYDVSSNPEGVSISDGTPEKKLDNFEDVMDLDVEFDIPPNVTSSTFTLVITASLSNSLDDSILNSYEKDTNSPDGTDQSDA